MMEDNLITITKNVQDIKSCKENLFCFSIVQMQNLEVFYEYIILLKPGN